MEFALSTDEVSNDVTYILVVFSESCPMASLIVEIEIFLLLATLAMSGAQHNWSMIYSVQVVLRFSSVYC